MYHALEHIFNMRYIFNSMIPWFPKFYVYKVDKYRIHSNGSQRKCFMLVLKVLLSFFKKNSVKETAKFFNKLLEEIC